MTLTEANEDFMAHRSVCKTCRSNGPAVCYVGMNLLRIFHQVLVEATLQELREIKAERARA